MNTNPERKKCQGKHCKCMNLDGECRYPHYGDCKDCNPYLNGSQKASSPEVPEWEGELHGWRKQLFLSMMRLGMAIHDHEMKAEFEAIEALVDEARNEVRNQTLEEAAEALEKDMPQAWFPGGSLELKKRVLEISVALVRGL